ncbi:MAG: hypothetical protein Kow0010_04590 [Dehalococcoidia bacterium]
MQRKNGNGTIQRVREVVHHGVIRMAQAPGHRPLHPKSLKHTLRSKPVTATFLPPKLVKPLTKPRKRPLTVGRTFVGTRGTRR